MNPRPFIDVMVEELYSARFRQGLSQQAVADRMGCAHTLISNWERNAQPPSLESLIRWADALGMEVVLVSREDELMRERHGDGSRP